MEALATAAVVVVSMAVMVVVVVAVAVAVEVVVVAAEAVMEPVVVVGLLVRASNVPFYGRAGVALSLFLTRARTHTHLQNRSLSFLFSMQRCYRRRGSKREEAERGFVAANFRSVGTLAADPSIKCFQIHSRAYFSVIIAWLPNELRTFMDEPDYVCFVTNSIFSVSRSEIEFYISIRDYISLRRVYFILFLFLFPFRKNDDNSWYSSSFSTRIGTSRLR